MQTDDSRIPEDEKQTLTTKDQVAAQQEAEDMETIRVRGPQRPGDEQRLADYQARTGKAQAPAAPAPEAPAPGEGKAIGALTTHDGPGQVEP